MPKTCCGGYNFSRSLRPRIGPLPFLVLHCSKSHNIIKSSVLFPSIATIWITKGANKFNHSTIFCMMPVPTISQSFKLIFSAPPNSYNIFLNPPHMVKMTCSPFLDKMCCCPPIFLGSQFFSHNIYRRLPKN